jgi:CMP/dCMP kinase
VVITIDGPAGTGKSSVAQHVAERIGFDFLDTGAMYRAVGLAALRRGVNPENESAVAEIAEACRISFNWSKRPPAVLLDGEDVAHLIRGSEATRAASVVAQFPAVRAVLVREQQRMGREHGQLVTEGRDQGTVVFPWAPVKIYLDATPEERARRRAAQLRNRGESPIEQEILREILERDRRDAGRSVGPLAVPSGAIMIDTTNLTQEQVIEQIVTHAKRSLVA